MHDARDWQAITKKEGSTMAKRKRRKPATKKRRKMPPRSKRTGRFLKR